jgi:hypothetical protein
LPNGFPAPGQPPLLIETEDLSVAARPRILRVPAGLLVDHADGSASLVSPTPPPGLVIATQDASVSGTPATLKVTNGTLVDNLDGSFSLDTGGGGGGGTATSVQLVVHNDTGGTLAKGTCVVNTADGGFAHPTVGPSDPALNYTWNVPLGVLAEDIADGADGVCTTLGPITGIDTSAFSLGDVLTCDSSGALTNNLSSDAALIQFAIALDSATSGSIFVLPWRQAVPIHAHNSDGAGGAHSVGFQVTIDGGSDPITAGDKFDLELPWDIVLQSVTLLADQSGSIVVDLWRADYSAFPPTSVGSICASALPTLSSSDHSQDTTLSGWTTTLSKGQVLRVHVNSASSVQRVTLSLKGTRNGL